MTQNAQQIKRRFNYKFRRSLNGARFQTAARAAKYSYLSRPTKSFPSFRCPSDCSADFEVALASVGGPCGCCCCEADEPIKDSFMKLTKTGDLKVKSSSSDNYLLLIQN